MTPPPRAAPLPAGPLAIQLSCPKCGAPLVVDDEVVAATCRHCSSLLIAEAPGRDEIYVVEGQIRGEADLLELVVLYRVQAQRAEIVNRYQDRDGNPPAESFIEARLREYEQRLRAVTRVLEARAFQAPYWHITGAIVQGILGRHRDGPKLVRLRAFAVEHTVPGYDVARANLRDRGLRLARAKVRPLTVRDVRARGPFLPWLPVPDRPYREIDKWRGQDLDRDFDPVTKHALFLFARRVLVYRPYWLARVLSDTGQEWILADGSFATLGGHPSEIEARDLQAGCIGDPLRSGEESYRAVRLVASRCPDCGHEQSFEARDHLVVCASCHRGLAPTAEGIRLVSYAHERADGTDYLPFWRFEFEVRLAGEKAPLTRIEDYVRALLGAQLPAGFAAAGPHLWVPAFRLLGTVVGDQAFKGLLEWVHAARLDVDEEKIPVGSRAVSWGVTVGEDAARALAPFVLLGLHGKASAARLNTLLLKKAIQGAAVAVSRPTLVMVPFRRNGEHVERDAVSLPMLLLRGGPELVAQRVTVHAAHADAPGAGEGV